MEDLWRELQVLKARLRLLTLALVGAIVVGLMGSGGADAVARALVEAPGWKVSTRNQAGTQSLDRLVVTADADVARIQVQNANLELAQQATAPASPALGTLWFDSAKKRLSYCSGTNPVVWTLMGADIGCRLYHNVNYTIPEIQWNMFALHLNSERYDTDDMHSTTADTMKIVFPTPGKYLLSGNVYFSGPANARVELGIVKNPTFTGSPANKIVNFTGTYLADVYTTIPADGLAGLNVSAIADLASTDFVCLVVSSSEANTQVQFDSAWPDYTPVFVAQRLN